MRLTLNRNAPGTCTIGDLLLDGEVFCHTLEPKVPIPSGTYTVLLTISPESVQGHLWSPRADHVLPLVNDVPGHLGIRIHAGNSASDTKGCILVGDWTGGEVLSGSRLRLENLLDRMEIAVMGKDSISIEICDPVLES